MATAYDKRVVRGERPGSPALDARRVIAAGERMLDEYELPPELRAAIEANFVRLCAELAGEPKDEQSEPTRRSRAKAA